MAAANIRSGTTTLRPTRSANSVTNRSLQPRSPTPTNTRGCTDSPRRCTPAGVTTWPKPRPSDAPFPSSASLRVSPLKAREAGICVLLGDRRVLAGKLAHDSAVGDFDAVGVDSERIVVVQFFGQVVQRRLDTVFRQRTDDVQYLEVEIAFGDNRFGRDAVLA